MPIIKQNLHDNLLFTNDFLLYKNYTFIRYNLVPKLLFDCVISDEDIFN